jgi:hypothetical protein
MTNTARLVAAALIALCMLHSTLAASDPLDAQHSGPRRHPLASGMEHTNNLAADSKGPSASDNAAHQCGASAAPTTAALPDGERCTTPTPTTEDAPLGLPAPATDEAGNEPESGVTSTPVPTSTIKLDYLGPIVGEGAPPHALAQCRSTDPWGARACSERRWLDVQDRQLGPDVRQGAAGKCRAWLGCVPQLVSWGCCSQVACGVHGVCMCSPHSARAWQQGQGKTCYGLMS